MTWVVDNDLRNYLAGSGSVSQFFSGGSVVFRDSENNVLSTHSITAVDVNANVVEITFAPSTVGANGSNSTADNALIRSAGNALGLSTDSIGDTDADILFESGQHEGWTENGAVSGGVATFTVAASATRGT